MNLNINQKQFNSLAAGLIIVAAIIVYSNTFQVPLQFDDIYHVTQKQTIRDLGNFSKIDAWKDINERPLAMFTLALNFRWGEVNTTGYHIFNLIFHILTGWVVYLLTLQILSLKNIKLGRRITDNKELFALLAALLFIVHPLQTQAVTYIIQRITVLATLFYFLGVYYYIRGRVTQIDTDDWRSGIKYYVLTFIAFVLGMLSKQIVVTLPLALLLVELFFIRNKEGRINLRYLSVAAGAVVFFIIAGLSLYGLPRESQEIPRDVYLITSFKVMVKYLQMFVVPANQNLDHDIEASETLFGWRELVSLAILLGLIYLAYRQFKKNPLISFGIAWFFITLSVEQSLIPIKDFMFEHRVYLPSLGLIIASLAALFTYLPMVNFSKSKVPGAVFLTVILVLIYGIAANARNSVWKTDLSLWSDAVKKSPEKARPYLWQGIAYTNVQQFEEAKASIDKCIEILPNFPMAYYNRGNIYKDLGQFKEALEDYNRAIALDSTYMLAYFNRGVVSGKLGMNKNAISDYDRTLKEDPDNVNTLYNRGNAHRKMRQYQQAIADYDQVIKIDPDYTLAIFNRGLSKAAMGNHEEALKDFDLAIRKDTKNHLFFNGKGVSLYQLGRYDEAIANYDAALRVNPNFGQAYYNRGFAKFFGKGDQEAGCADWETALKYKYPSARGMLIQYCGQTAQNLQ